MAKLRWGVLSTANIGRTLIEAGVRRRTGAGDQLRLRGVYADQVADGRLIVPDPWLCRASHLELFRDGDRELVPVDPLGLTDPERDGDRIELDTVGAGRGSTAPASRPHRRGQHTTVPSGVDALTGIGPSEGTVGCRAVSWWRWPGGRRPARPRTAGARPT
jgi:hypothetical protein